MVKDSAVFPISLKRKMKVEEDTDPQDEINVYLKVIKTVPLKIKRSETVSQLKAKLAKTEGADPELQELFFHGDHLQDNKLLAEHGISSGNTLSLYLSPELRFQIFVKTPEGKISLLVKSSDSTQSIKARIQDAEAIPAGQQTLVFEGRALEEDNYLQAYNIKMNSTLHLLLEKNQKMRVYVKTRRGGVLEFDARALYTVWDLKTMIKSRVQIPKKQQRLSYYGKQLLKDHRTLASYKIRSQCILHLSYPTMKISVLDPTDKYVISLEAHRADKAADVMKRIKQKILRDDGDQYGFMFHGEVMRADGSLGDYGVEDGCVLRMVRALGGGNGEYVLYV